MSVAALTTNCREIQATKPGEMFNSFLIVPDSGRVTGVY
jgi:hypothetical protein